MTWSAAQATARELHERLRAVHQPGYLRMVHRAWLRILEAEEREAGVGPWELHGQWRSDPRWHCLDTYRSARAARAALQRAADSGRYLALALRHRDEPERAFAG